MSKRDFGGLGKGWTPGGRDEGIGPTGPDEQGDASRKGSDMAAADSTQQAPLGDPNQPAEEGARIHETPSVNSDTERKSS